MIPTDIPCFRHSLATRTRTCPGHNFPKITIRRRKIFPYRLGHKAPAHSTHSPRYLYLSGVTHFSQASKVCQRRRRAGPPSALKSVRRKWAAHQHQQLQEQQPHSSALTGGAPAHQQPSRACLRPILDAG